jgi:hypothetical protein
MYLFQFGFFCTLEKLIGNFNLVLENVGVKKKKKKKKGSHHGYH